MQAAGRTKPFEELLKFSPFALWRVSAVDQPERGSKVEVMDLRFGDPQEPRFVSTAIVDEGNRVVRSWFEF
jgi:hypothetical protein